ncbi:Serine--tRNA ligase [Nosema granulosis]|uniref:serine--tRNA ligase n=1 Tax=Nosema granulosis TaxID=83296 RepID=A0A9P6GYZ8_9MICR|nr:Serine--tRNA ligase [Nosema granulosis]
MIDINLIRDDKSREMVTESEKSRFKDHTKVLDIYIKDKERIRVGFELDHKNKHKNLIQKQIRDAYKKDKNTTKDSIKDLLDQFKEAEKEAQTLQETLKNLDEEITVLLKNIGNIVDKRCVVSKDEEKNEVISTFRSARALYKAPKPYSALMANYTYSNSGSKIVGHRGYYLSGKMAKLGQALSRYAVDFLEEKGYLYIQTPVMMRKDVMARTSQLSDFDDQLYKVEDDLYLIATSEQPLTALHMDERLTDSDLPKIYAGQSLCFRKEAGAHGKDNAGLFRVHQFEKIEQFIVCKPEDSETYHTNMIKISEEFYRSLDISFNVVSIVSGELNDAASLKYDLEAYFPSFDKYRELVSCSNCTDYQSRELEVRYGLTKENNKKVYVHMLNGTLCAVQRTLCCIVENYQDDGKIVVPTVLRKYTGFDSIDLE